MLGAALFGWSLAVGPSLLASSPDCPAAGRVEARVREILGLHDNAAFEERATLEREGGSLRVTLRGQDERVLGDRLLAADGSCSELAGAVAVVLAAWLSDFHPEFVGSLPEGAAPALPPPEPIVKARDVTDQAPKRVTRPATGRAFSLSAALGADVSSKSAAPFASLGARLGPERAGFGGAATATFVAARTLELSAGSVRYFRWPLSLGPTLRVPIAAATLELHVGATVSWLHVEGVGFATSATHDALRGGAFASTRVSFGAERLLPFAELSGLFFGSTEAFVERGRQEPSVSLPSVELLAAVGAAWRP